MGCGIYLSVSLCTSKNIFIEAESHAAQVGWPGVHSVAEDDLELRILQPLSPKCWDERCKYVCVPCYRMLGLEARVSCMQTSTLPN